MATTKPSKEEIEAFHASLPAKNLEPLWSKMSQLVPPFPNPKAAVTTWKYAECEPLLLRSGDIVEAEEAERRVLMLVNKDMQAPHTTDTIYGGLQLILPGEVAPAHRHIAFAMRFIISSTLGFTAVEGQKMYMLPGDVILTPSWHWHDHGNEGADPVVWLDGLNLPLFTSVPLNFAEMWKDPRYPSEENRDCEWRFPWTDTEKAFAEMEGGHKRFVYRLRNGRPLSETLGAQAERIAVGHRTEESQETTSFMYHVYHGRGRTIITPPEGKEVVTVEWQEKDTFAVPAWSKIVHVNEGDVEVDLFAVNDRPWVEHLGLYRSGDWAKEN